MRGRYVLSILCAAAALARAAPSPDFIGREEAPQSPSRRDAQIPFDFDHAGGTEDSFEVTDGPRYPPHESRTIYQIVSDSLEFSKFAKAVDFVDDVVAYLNDSTADLTFFVAPDYDHDHLATRHEFYGIVAAIEGLTNRVVAEDSVRRAVASLLEYHTIPERLKIHDAPATASYPTRLAMSSSEDMRQRLKIEQRKHRRVAVNGRRIIREPIRASNGVIYVLDLPLSTPGSVYQALLDSSASTMLSAIKHAGLSELFESTSLMTVFAPDDRAFDHLPEDLRAYLFSEAGKPALKKLLEYHVAPNVLFYTDYVHGLAFDAMSLRRPEHDFVETEDDLVDTEDMASDLINDESRVEEIYIIIQVEQDFALQDGFPADHPHSPRDTHPYGHHDHHPENRQENARSPRRGGNRKPRDRRAPVFRKEEGRGERKGREPRPRHEWEGDHPPPPPRFDGPCPFRGDHPPPPPPFRGDSPREDRDDGSREDRGDGPREDHEDHFDEYPPRPEQLMRGPPSEDDARVPPSEYGDRLPPPPPPPRRGPHPPPPPPDCDRHHPRPPCRGDHPPPPPPPFYGDHPGPHHDEDNRRPPPPSHGPLPPFCGPLPPPPPPPHHPDEHHRAHHRPPPPPPPPRGPPHFPKPSPDALISTLDAQVPTLAGAPLYARVERFALPHPPFPRGPGRQAHDERYPERKASRGPSRKAHDKPPRTISRLTVDGVHVLTSDSVTANGPMHVLSRVLCPRQRGAENLEQTMVDEHVDPWADWEDWLPQWAEES
ncbi:uncharacterized protein SCHCODRAFT_02525527 [Schizophyllum commune H4-8]|uniref:FAS1 domain-containing protein n=1 Tax=Schizophyllum commune (strain H4-8 / FGSC 9210) TaxID=578458 RepID=D8PW62_SCHCM|nr:uncharacterized protein SCHCODRAFT_02525527 [Schizophyllum commune H4-8]KAI5900076.1 hypothetical protein SCHCODRAFT_02525527 [Schizophyllum commune H4-8]